MGNSGKSAAGDVLREVDGIFVPHFQFEFDVIRVAGGLLDLRHHVATDWSPVRSHAAIHAFRDVVHKMGCNPAWWDVRGLARSTSQRYDRQFAGRFIEYSEQFLSALVIAGYPAEWPYDDLRIGPLHRFCRKVLRRTGFRNKLKRNVLLVDGRDFDTRAREYLSRLYSEIVPPEAEIAVLNNGFEPFNPVSALDMLEGAQQIVVIRDPRDVYVSGLSSRNLRGGDQRLVASDNDGLNKSFLATDDLDIFVRRMKVYHARLYAGDDSRVLRIRFEDLALNYRATIARILDFLGVAHERHARPRQHFVPERSSQGVGIWRQYSRSDEIRLIERELPEFLYER